MLATGGPSDPRGPPFSLPAAVAVARRGVGWAGPGRSQEDPLRVESPTDPGGASELTWQLAGYLIYKTSGSISLLAGWRYFSIDYESGQGPSRFLYDMEIQGPALGMSWAF